MGKQKGISIAEDGGYKRKHHNRAPADISVFLHGMYLPLFGEFDDIFGSSPPSTIPSSL